MDIELRTLMEPVKKYYFLVNAGRMDNLADLNRNIRNWLGENCECVWETKMNYQDGGIGVYFDLDSSESDMMAFKLRWLE